MKLTNKALLVTALTVSSPLQGATLLNDYLENWELIPPSDWKDAGAPFGFPDLQYQNTDEFDNPIDSDPTGWITSNMFLQFLTNSLGETPWYVFDFFFDDFSERASLAQLIDIPAGEYEIDLTYVHPVLPEWATSEFLSWDIEVRIGDVVFTPPAEVNELDQPGASFTETFTFESEGGEMPFEVSWGASSEEPIQSILAFAPRELIFGVPEPSSSLMVTLAGLLLIAKRRRS